MKSIPSAIRATIRKAALCIGLIAVFGIIWGVACGDRILLLLSAGMLAFGALKIVMLLMSAKSGRYEILECSVLEDKQQALLSRHQVTVISDGCEKTFSLTGRTILEPGRNYRLYLSGAGEDHALSSVPEYLRPPRTLLGFETIK